MHDGVADTLVSVRASCSPTELARRAKLRTEWTASRRYAGQFPTPSYEPKLRLQEAQASLALRQLSFARQGPRHWRRGPPATDVPTPSMDFLNFTGRESTTRTEAAKIGGLTLRIVRDRVLKFNAHGLAGLIDRKAPGQARRLNDTHRAGPIPVIHGVVRWRIVDPMDLGGIPRNHRQAAVEPRTARHRRSQTFGSSSPSVLG